MALLRSFSEAGPGEIASSFGPGAPVGGAATSVGGTLTGGIVGADTRGDFAGEDGLGDAVGEADLDCFYDKSSLDFYNVTAPNAPYYSPFVTGDKLALMDCKS